MESKNLLSDRGRAVWRLYLGLHGVFAFLYGAFASYAYLYLGIQLRLAGAQDRLPTGLLPLMAGTLLLEALVAPAAGAFADKYGRRTSVRLGLSLLGLSYVCFAALPILRALFPEGEQAAQAVVATGLAGVALMSMAVAFHSNALDAWFVDELLGNSRIRRVPALQLDLHPFFARQAQVFGGSLLAGGMLALFFGQELAASARKEELVFEAPGSVIWIVGALLVALTALWLAPRIHETSKVPAGAGGTGRPPFLRQARQALRSRELLRALVLASAVYLCGLALVYFVPTLLHEKAKEPGNGLARWISQNYVLFYLLSGLTRVFGPGLGLRRQSRSAVVDHTPLARLNQGGLDSRKRQAWRVGAWGFGGVLLAGLSFLFVPAEHFWLPVGAVLLAKLAIEAFKPVQAALLNELVPSTPGRSTRAFTISLATPVGSAALGGLALVLISFQGASAGSLPVDQPSFAIPVLFCAFGFVAFLLLRAVTRPARSLFEEPWLDRRRRLRTRLREEMKKMQPTDEGDFIRPLGAGDDPVMRPSVLRAARRSYRVPKPGVLKGLERPDGEPRQGTEDPGSGHGPGLTRGKEGRAHLQLVHSGPGKSE